MKSMQPPSAAIFFMTYFYRARGGGPWPPWPPPGSATVKTVLPTAYLQVSAIGDISGSLFDYSLFMFSFNY